jgi:opacity protein-like surface antigen
MIQRSRSSGWWLAALVLAFAVDAAAQTVSVQLKNGDRITGQVLSETNNRVVLSNAWSAAISIPVADITNRIIILPLFAATPTNTVAGTNIVATNAVALAKVVASTNTLFTQPWMKNWHGDIQAGVDLTFSERNRQVYNAKAKIIYARKRFKTVFDYDMTYGRSQIEELDTATPAPTDTRTVYRTDANRMNGSIKTDFDLTKRWYVYNLAGAGFDEIRKIDLRYEIGPGVGYHLIQWTNFFMNVEAGATYQMEERSDGSELSKFYGRLAENAAWKITPRLTWDEKFEYFPRIDHPGEFRMRFETNLRYAMLQNVFFNLSVIDMYDSDPPDGVTENDLQVRSSIGVKF